MSELHLLEGERLIIDVSPTPNFRRYVTVKAALAGLPFLAMVNVMVAMSFYVGTGGAPVTKVGVGPLLATYAFLYFILAAIVIASTFTLANLMYKKYHYWASDVAVTRTFLETICGVGGVVVREMTGELKFGYWYGE